MQQEIQRTGYEDLLASGVVITGGAVLLEGMPEIAEDVLGLPVRMGVPNEVGGLVDIVGSSLFATGVGLLKYGRDNEADRYFKVRAENKYGKVKKRMQSWLGEIF